MKTGKMVAAGSGLVAVLALGAVVLRDGGPDVEPRGEAHGESVGDDGAVAAADVEGGAPGHVFLPGGEPLALLVVGENDVLIRRGWLDADGRGAFSTDTGTTGMTAGGLFSVDARLLDRQEIAEASEAAVGRMVGAAAGHDPVFAAEVFDGVEIAVFDPDSGLETLRSLGRKRIFGLGEGLLDLAIEPGSCAALIGPSGAGKVTLLSCQSGPLDPSTGATSLSGRSDLRVFVDFLGEMKRAGRLEPGPGSESVAVTDLDLWIFEIREGEEPSTRLHESVVGTFSARRPGEDPLPLGETVHGDIDDFVPSEFGGSDNIGHVDVAVELGFSLRLE